MREPEFEELSDPGWWIIPASSILSARFSKQHSCQPLSEDQFGKSTGIIGYTRNARTHSKKQVKQIASSVERFGFVNPVLIGNDGTIIAGHGRVPAR